MSPANACAARPVSTRSRPTRNSLSIGFATMIILSSPPPAPATGSSIPRRWARRSRCRRWDGPRALTYRDSVRGDSRATVGETPVHPKIVQLDGFEVIGIAVRTNNAKEGGPDGVIPKLWQRVMQEHVLDRVPDKACLLYTAPSPRDGLLSRM